MTTDFRIENLEKRITKVGLDEDTDFPCEVQVDSASDGVMHFIRFDVDDYGYIDGPPHEYDGTFADALQEAIDRGVSEIEIGGLSAREALDLLLSPKFHSQTIELFEHNGDGNGIAINGLRLFLEGGHLLDEDDERLQIKDSD